MKRIKWKARYITLLSDVLEVSSQIRTEIMSRPQHSNIGKKGCLKRLQAILEKHRFDY